MTAEQPRRIGQVLLTTGLTTESPGAAAAARTVASTLGGALHALHVIEPLSPYAERAVPGLVAAHDQQARSEFEKFASTHGLAGSSLHVRRGSPVQEVLLAAHELSADLLVVGRYGRGGLKVGRLGSVADRLARLSPVSVLVVPPEFGGKIARVGVATDFGEASDLALRRAAELGRAFGAAEIVLLHSFEVPAGHHMIASWEDTCRQLTAVAEQLGREQAARVLGGAAKVRVRVGEGGPERVVPALASEDRLDLIVVGTHSRTRAAEALLGQSSERIIRNAPCAVWAEKSPGLIQGVVDALKEWLR